MEQDCTLCGERCGGALVCPECERGLIRAPASTAAAAFEYRFPLDRLVHRFKYGGDLAIGSWLAARLADRVSSEPRPDVLVAPPLWRARLRERGFNQSIELAKVVGRRLGVRCDATALEKIRETSTQQGLTRRARRANLRGAYRCRRQLSGLRVAVVDDVMTTGATFESLAATLRDAGAASVQAWVVALAPRRGA